MSVSIHLQSVLFFFFFFNDTATTEIYTLSLHDALPICASTVRSSRSSQSWYGRHGTSRSSPPTASGSATRTDRKSTRLNSSHANISYAVFCLKKKKKKEIIVNFIKHDILENTTYATRRS